MKVLIAYYSKTGNTEKAAKAINDNLSKKGIEVQCEKIRPLKDEGLIGGSLKAILRYEVPIMNQNLDVSKYDLVIVGSPMWAGSPAPAINSYLTDIEGLRAKDAALFVTSAGEFGRFAARNIAHRIRKKGGKVKGYVLLTDQDLSSDTATRSIVNNFIKTIVQGAKLKD